MMLRNNAFPASVVYSASLLHRVSMMLDMSVADEKADRA